jgi:hypothetical protein
VPPPTPAIAARLLAGHHLLLPGEELLPEPAAAGATLPVPALLELLQEDAARRRAPLRLQPTAPPLLARGTREALSGARALLADLDQQGAALDVELLAWLTPGAPRVGTYPSPQVVAAAVQGAEPLGSAVVRSGSTAVLGARSTRSFVAGYTVEIASGSGVAGPALGRVLTGRWLRVRASRVRAGAAVALEGFLDVAQLLEMGAFDPGTADLGVLQQPRVGALQVAFGGVVPLGGALAVSISGAPLSEPDWTLWLVARGSASPPQGPEGWRACDVAFLGEPVVELPLPRPGSVLDALERDDDERLEEAARRLMQSLSPAEVAQAADAARAAAGRPGRTPIVWGGGLVLAPRGEQALWAEVDQLVTAAEAPRLGTAALEVTHGDLRVTLPVLAGLPVRVLAVEERAVLGGYDLQVAQDTWMPHPQVQRALDGLLVQGRTVGGRFEGSAWRSASAAPEELGRERTGLARLQLEQRRLASAGVRVPPAGEVAAIPADEGSAELRLGLTPLR